MTTGKPDFPEWLAAVLLVAGEVLGTGYISYKLFINIYIQQKNI
jgi:hypothetical protein